MPLLFILLIFAIIIAFLFFYMRLLLWMLFSPDYVGTSDELADQLFEHAGFQRADEVAFALPFTFGADDYAQIISDLAEKLGPALGWQPATSA